MRVLGISCVTNHAAGVVEQKLVHSEVLEVGARMKDTLIELLRRIVPELVRE
jgi:purine-nucleoside phosphorylase